MNPRVDPFSTDFGSNNYNECIKGYYAFDLLDSTLWKYHLRSFHKENSYVILAEITQFICWKTPISNGDGILTSYFLFSVDLK